jgi:hypothetical protein
LSSSSRELPLSLTLIPATVELCSVGFELGAAAAICARKSTDDRAGA